MTTTYKGDGGPAFPVPGLMDDAEFNGMTLRDYFAAKASDKDIECIIVESSVWVGEYLQPTITRQQARYRHADAMLEARK